MSFDAIKLNTSAAMKYNAKSTDKYKWDTHPSSPYDSAGDPALAKELYCFQHDAEGCKGECIPLKKSIDCYNRDGMMGKRTLQLIANNIATGGVWGEFWKQRIILPPGMVAAGQKVPPPASDVRAEVATSAKHLSEVAKTNGKLKKVVMQPSPKLEPQQAGIAPLGKKALIGIGIFGTIAIGWNIYEWWLDRKKAKAAGLDDAYDDDAAKIKAEMQEILKKKGKLSAGEKEQLKVLTDESKQMASMGREEWNREREWTRWTRWEDEEDDAWRYVEDWDDEEDMKEHLAMPMFAFLLSNGNRVAWRAKNLAEFKEEAAQWVKGDNVTIVDIGKDSEVGQGLYGLDGQPEPSYQIKKEGGEWVLVNKEKGNVVLRGSKAECKKAQAKFNTEWAFARWGLGGLEGEMELEEIGGNEDPPQTQKASERFSNWVKSKKQVVSPEILDWRMEEPAGGRYPAGKWMVELEIQGGGRAWYGAPSWLYPTSKEYPIWEYRR